MIASLTHAPTGAGIPKKGAARAFFCFLEAFLP